MDPVPLTIPLWADLLAVSIGSLQGAMFAAGFRDRRLDLLGVAIIGTATGLGGGLLRDVFLDVTPAALSSNWLMLVAVAAALGGMLLERIFTRLDVVITALDALTIGLSAPSARRRPLRPGCRGCPRSSSASSRPSAARSSATSCSTCRSR